MPFDTTPGLSTGPYQGLSQGNGLSRGNGLYAGTDSAAAAYFAAVAAAGGTISPSRRAIYNTLFISLRNSTVLTTLDRLWIFAAENTQTALIDLVARSTATAVNSPTFTANRGYAGNGTTSYIDTGFNASTAGGNFVQNDAHQAVWIETAHSGATDRREYMGNDFGAQYSVIGQLNTQFETGVNSSAPVSPAVSNKIGMWLVQRTAAAAVELFNNGASFATGTPSSSAVANSNFFVLCTATLNVPGGFVDGRVSFASMGKSLTAAQNAAFYTALRTFMTAVGVA